MMDDDYICDFVDWLREEAGVTPDLALMVGIDDGKSTVMFLPVPKFHSSGLFIACGSASEYAKEWLSQLGSKGYAVHVCDTIEDAKSAVLRYMT